MKGTIWLIGAIVALGAIAWLWKNWTLAKDWLREKWVALVGRF